MKKQIDSFLENLSLVECDNQTNNLYNGNSSESQIRRHNVTLYLNKMVKANPKLLLLGEAPGYKGCGLSGIPFTSESVLYENLFFSGEDFRFIAEKGKYQTEVSATIVWDEISNLTEKPLIWNIFPFHPHSHGNPKSNRTPTREELIEGRSILEELLTLFKIEKIIALGRKPESQLSGVSTSYSYVRHPSFGGKNLFIEGFKRELNLLK